MLHTPPIYPTSAATAQQTVCAAPPTEETYIEAALRQPVPRRVRYSRRVRRWRRIVMNAKIACFALVATNTSMLPEDARKICLFLLAVLCEFCVFAIVATLVTLPRLQWQADLLSDGVAVTGTVMTTPVQPWREVSPNHVTYVFQTLKGVTYTHTVSVPTEVLKRVAVGTETTILYDPNDHAVSYPYNAITVAELV